MKSWVLKFRLFLWLILAVIVGCLLYKGVVPSGKISYVYDFTNSKAEKASWFIQKLTPEERVKLKDKTPATVFGDPVYFALRTPRRFSKAKLSLKYRRQDKGIEFPIGNTIPYPIIEAGVLVDKVIWRYDLQPIENRIINELTKTWEVINENKVMFLQKEKQFSSIDEFLENLPDRNEIALYNYDLDQEFLLPDYASSTEENKIDIALRGPWQFYTYINGEDMEFNFTFVDLNQNKDSDPIDLQIYYSGQLIDSKHLADERPPLNPPPGKGEEERELELKLINLPEGVYKIELRVNDDIVTKNITTKQSKLAFINRLWLLDSGDKEMEIYTDSRVFNAQTINPGNLQTIKIFGPLTSSLPPLELEISKTYRQFSTTTPGNENLLVIPKDDVIISGDGVFGLQAGSLINSQFKKVTIGFNAEEQGINYILANYTVPAEDQGWQVAQAEFDLTRAYREFNKYNFIISIPGLKADDEIEDYIEIKEIKVELEGTALREKVGKIFK